jgi:hypothetical protein
LNFAVTVTSFDTIIEHEVADATVQFPDHAPNVDPAFGVSVRVIGVPTGTRALQTVPPPPQLISCVVPFIPSTEPFWLPSKVTVNTGSGTTGTVGAVVYRETTVARIVDVITEVLPVVVVPIAVMVVE